MVYLMMGQWRGVPGVRRVRVVHLVLWLVSLVSRTVLGGILGVRAVMGEFACRVHGGRAMMGFVLAVGGGIV